MFPLVALLVRASCRFSIVNADTHWHPRRACSAHRQGNQRKRRIKECPPQFSTTPEILFDEGASYVNAIHQAKNDFSKKDCSTLAAYLRACKNIGYLDLSQNKVSNELLSLSYGILYHILVVQQRIRGSDELPCECL